MTVPQYHNYIGSQWKKPSTDAYFKNINPADQEDVVGEYPLSAEADVEEALQEAHLAFREWRSLTAEERNVYLNRLAQLIDQRQDDIGDIICREEGKILAEAKREGIIAVDYIHFVMGEGQRMEGTSLPSPRKGVSSVARRVPLGVIAAISPWNFPFITPIRKIVPALAAGNTVVFKPSNETPHSGVLLMELIHQAGFPKGVVNMVIGSGSDIGDALCAHPLVKGITFTGSTEVGQHIHQQAATHPAAVQLEMGGKNPAIVAEAKDLNVVARDIIKNAFSLTGQRCTAISRLIVLEPEVEPLVEAIKEQMESIVMGNGKDPDVFTGPLIHQDACKKVMGYINEAVEQGALVIAGGKRLTGGIYDKGCYVQPTLLANVNRDMRLAREEVFGPVLAVFVAATFEEAMKMANDTDYGLAASIFADNPAYIGKFLEEIEAGMAHVNHGTTTDPTMPFGGVKNSYLGPFSKGFTNKEFFTTWKVTYTKYY